MKPKSYSVLLLIIFLGFFYQFKYINEFPSHIHAWAQSDRYALSLGFLDNGLNFFKPQTFVYNHQFPNDWKVPSDETITAVDFPIQEYVSALLMKITGNTEPVIFRIYILLYSFIGLFFLFKLSYTVTKDYLKSIFVVIFAATSPVYVYYQAGLLPTIPSLSNSIIGIYFYYLYLKENKNKSFNISILILTLAALSRTTFAIPLVSVLAIEFIRLMKRETNFLNKLIPVGISILSLLSYFLYNGFLREKYGSLFLNHIMPPDNFGHAKEIIMYVFDTWFFQYFTELHYFILAVILVVFAFFMIIRKSNISKTNAYFGLLALTYLFGCLIFSYLMMGQFSDHDYYFLDTFFLAIIMALIFIFSLIPSAEKRNFKIITISILCFVSYLLILQPIKSQEKRRETGFWDMTATTVNNYKNSSVFLDSLGISKSSKILVIDAVAPNIPFILMQRKGYAVMNTNKKNIEQALKWNFDYIVFQNEYFIPDIYTTYPEILSKLIKVADNGKISVCKHSNNKKQSLLDFIGFTCKKSLFTKIETFENTNDSSWQNINKSYKYAKSGNSSGHLTPDIIYGLTYQTKNLPALKSSSRALFFSSYFLKDTAVGCEIVVSINEDGKNIYYKSYDLNEMIKQKNVWIQVSQLFQLPIVQDENYELTIFIWNKGRSELFYDNFEFTIY